MAHGSQVHIRETQLRAIGGSLLKVYICSENEEALANTVCGRCGTYTHMTVLGASIASAQSDTNDYCIETAFRCDACRRMNIGASDSGIVPAGWGSGAAVAWWDTNSPQGWAPNFVQGQDFPDVPNHISAAASEAHQTFSIEAFQSAVQIGRASCRERVF